MEDKIEGVRGWAQRVPPDQLRPTLTGDRIGTLDYWWIKMNEAIILMADLDKTVMQPTYP